MEIVNLRVYRGKVTYNENGQVTSENQTFKVRRPSKEWGLLLKNAPLMYTKVEIVEVLKEEIKHSEKTVNGKIVPVQSHEYSKVEASDEIKYEISNLFSKAKPETADEKIAKLQAQLDKLTANKNEGVKVAEKPEPSNNDELELARLKYFQLFGEKPSHLLKLKSLNAKIAEKEAEL